MGNEGDPRFNGGQQLRIHDGGARSLVRDFSEDLAEQAPIATETVAAIPPPPGTVGADRARSTPVDAAEDGTSQGR